MLISDAIVASRIFELLEIVLNWMRIGVHA